MKSDKLRKNILVEYIRLLKERIRDVLPKTKYRHRLWKTKRFFHLNSFFFFCLILIALIFKNFYHKKMIIKSFDQCNIFFSSFTPSHYQSSEENGFYIINSKFFVFIRIFNIITSLFLLKCLLFFFQKSVSSTIKESFSFIIVK